MGGHVIDWDAARASRKARRDPIVVKALGEDWEIPPGAPAAAMLIWSDIQAMGPDSEVDVGVLVDTMKAVLTPDLFAALVASGADLEDDVLPLTAQVMDLRLRASQTHPAQRVTEEGDGDDEGNLPATAGI